MATLSSYLLSSPPLCKSRFSATSLVSGIDFISFSPRTTLSSSSTVLPAILSLSVKHNRRRNSLQVKSVASPTETISEFDEMVSGTKRKSSTFLERFFCSGMLVPVEGPEAPLFALEINPEKAREEFRSASQMNGGTGVKDFMDGMGLGMLVEQLGELKLGELLDTPPPGLDEAIAISKEFCYSIIVFDTAPTGHTLRLLSLPDFLDASIGKILKLRQKITSATSAIKSVFGKEEKGPDAADKLEKLRERMVKVRELFRDTESTEFVIVTIPTVMAVSESSRLSASLKKESVPVKRLIVNQLLPPSSSDCKFCSIKRKDQMRALDMIREDSELSALTLMEAPLVDMEIRGVPALRFLGDIIWK
ncbi:unnamed protein product [Arabidopsis thaliana]|uniref:(thale cress) hypothetical protein n=1 Tax=Arabidopsis thaliana TaxID=3702 RepID=A0A7G2ENU1_ARATH|nr:unnamed protein product [Arabidopsis thaliana]